MRSPVCRLKPSTENVFTVFTNTEDSVFSPLYTMFTFSTGIITFMRWKPIAWKRKHTPSTFCESTFSVIDTRAYPSTWRIAGTSSK